MRSLWWWGAAEMVTVLFLGEAKSKFAPLPDITNRTFIKQYIDIHNKFRSEVKPSASNMLYMTFDLALARIARAWANKCVWKHNPNQRYHPDRKFKPTGENMWLGGASRNPFNVFNPITAFHNEVNYYTFSTHQCTKVCGHYTQVVWAASYKVGCAVVYCRYMDGKEKNNNILVCNYAPAGNYRGVRPYKEGKPCSNCPEGDTCKDNLCRNPEREKENSIRYSRWYPPFESRIICDPSCIAVAVLRPLLMFLAFAVVYYLQICYPGLNFSK
ncbi:glioma pathogenesis-related protein 1 isoform X2 [Protobothrops mucrosquamatus]|uniref:glioma pathogenesis-related protein 1 isoform X2 n=1 Tax=Protobothrops mucrosquamatus TaxID=103944 RepID=UPI000775CAD6|nr:glioma pathogenesis-related protein 1 isoform X2 [Protobothrops mucrosquamatus]